VSAVTPLVSIIMPCHDAEAHLPSSVGSVLAQSHPDWELIAVDDGSLDDTLTWLRRQSDPRIQVLTQSNQGVSAARNAGLSKARGAYIAFLDSDDTWDAGFLRAMVNAVQAKPDAVLAYCGWQNVGLPGGRGQPFVPPDYESDTKAETLFAGCRWPIHAVLVKREAVLAAGGFDTSLKNAEDYALWLRVAIQAPIVRVPEVLACYHFHGDGQASTKRARAALQLLQAQERFLAEQPAFLARLGPQRARELTLGGLLARGYECYWQRDLPAARSLFRVVMKRRHGRLADWKYMLPAWLPERWHRLLIGLRDKGSDLSQPHAGPR
jgi:GT2 family glycosyltransferase